jgi:hypothetical protein
MKIQLSLLAALLLLFSACQNQNNSENTESETTTENTEANTEENTEAEEPEEEEEDDRLQGVDVDSPEGKAIQDQYHTVYPTQVVSSGFLKGKNEDYRPEFMVDHDPHTWWTPNPYRNGKGAYIELDFVEPTMINGFEIWAGSHQPNYPKYGNIFKLNNRAKAGRLEFSNGETIKFKLADVDNWQAVVFPPIKTTYIRLRIDEVYKGEKWDDLCISEFKALSNEPQYYDGGDEMIEGTAKPVIYLYPEKKTEVAVQLDYKGELHFTYPEYQNGWEVMAYPDGKIIDAKDGREYSYLFWDGHTNINWDLSKGFVVKGSETREFLQNQLAAMGLQPKEYNEFIVYWLPRMKNNPYNLIHFSEAQYEELAQLKINPQPDAILRVFMVWKSLDQALEIEPQEFPEFERKGFTVVEWGGAEVGQAIQ